MGGRDKVTRDERRRSTPLGQLLAHDEAEYMNITISADRKLVAVTSVNAQGGQITRYTPEQLEGETREHAEMVVSIIGNVVLHDGAGVVAWDLDGLRDARDLEPGSSELTGLDDD